MRRDSMKNINGNNKKLITKIGFGTWQIQKEKTCEVVLKAIELGYKHFDTAEGYGNLEEIGLAIKNSKIDRSQLFITSKLWVEDYKNEYIQKKAVNRILNQLEVDYVDLLLLHWPLEYNFDVNSILSNINILKERGLV